MHILSPLTDNCPTRAYPENTNFKTCAPKTLKFNTVCDLHKTKKCCKFELDILNSFWVKGNQKYIDYKVKCWECTRGYKWAIFSYFTFLLRGYCIKSCIKYLFLIQHLWYLADLCLDSMSIKLYCHIYNFGFAYKDIDIILSNDHIWNHWNLKGHISQTQ